MSTREGERGRELRTVCAAPGHPHAVRGEVDAVADPCRDEASRREREGEAHSLLVLLLLLLLVVVVVV